MKIVFRPAAIEDLDSALLHIAHDDPSTAIRVVDEIEVYCLEHSQTIHLLARPEMTLFQA